MPLFPRGSAALAATVGTRRAEQEQGEMNLLPLAGLQGFTPISPLAQAGAERGM